MKFQLCLGPSASSTRLTLIVIGTVLTAWGQIRQNDPPALPESGMPFLTTGAKGAVYLSWTDPIGDKEHALRFSRWTGSKWTEPETITRGRNWFVNWADFPSLNVLPDGTMLAHWLTRSADGGKYGYGIRIARRESSPSGWREIHGMSLDEKEDYAGFLAFVPESGEAIYLAPPANAPATSHEHENGHRKTVRFLSFKPDGTIESDRELDPDACSCCQTAVGRTTHGLIAAYRDHLPGEIRDISILRYAEGAWSQPRVLYPDHWQINACPTDGPSIASDGDHVAIAWLTRAADLPKVQIALSADEGRNFASPVRLDSGNPLGRPSVVRFDESSYLAVWLEKVSNAQAEIRLMRVGRSGKITSPLSVATVPSGRAAGFPKVAVAGDQVLVAWRDQRVRAAVLPRSAILGLKFKR